MNNKFDCIVAGGGPAGTAAAVACAKSGAKTLIIERQGCLGGAWTNMGVAPMMTFHAGKRQAIRGLAQDLIDRLVRENGSPGHVADGTGYVETVTPFDPEILKMELDRMAAEAGVTPLFHATLSDVDAAGGLIRSVRCVHKGGFTDFQAKVYVDATGDGDLGVMAGVPFEKGRLSDGLCQPMTHNVLLTHVDRDKIIAYMREHPEDFRHPKEGIEASISSQRLSICGFYSLLNAAKAAGDFTVPRETVLFFEMHEKGSVNVNVSRISGVDLFDPFAVSRAEIEGRAQAREIVRFLKKYVPGFENARMQPSTDWIGVRESRRLLGRYVVTADDLMRETVFPDAVAAAGYPIDIHNPGNAGNTDIHIRRGAFYTVPYRALVPQGIDNLLVCGRCLSATHEAAGALRTTPTCMATGEAAGSAAALSVRTGAAPALIDIRALREMNPVLDPVIP